MNNLFHSNQLKTVITTAGNKPLAHLSSVLLGALLLLTACSQPIKKITETNKPLPTETTIQSIEPIKNEKLKLTHVLPAAQPIDPLLEGIQSDDIVMSKRLAKQNFQRSWKTIAQRSRFVRQRLLFTLERLNAPTSLQVIPVVESTYNPYALSHAGALGLWQLMPRTARVLGVESGKKLNGRRNINISTAAAIHYLQKMHRRFDSWPLAIAAYNMGPYAVSKRLKKKPWKASDGLENMPIPAATRAYVQHIIGLIALIDDETFEFPTPITTRALELQAPIDIQRLAKLSGISENDIFRFNPCLNLAQYLHEKVTIHVPESTYASVQNNVLQAGPIYVNKTIQKGDNLWSIARAHHTSTQTIKSLNKGMGKYLRIGQRLKVPANRLTQSSADHNPLLTSGHRMRYKVRSGDSLWRIANRFGTTAKAIARVNQISTRHLIRVGDMLWVFAKVRPS